MLIIAIDGACRRNGKPDCTSAGGVFIQCFNEHNQLRYSSVLSNYEYNSTNQRGEMLALLTALDYIHHAEQEAQIITDSEYLFNAMTKHWYINWANKNWVTASGEPVKNKDIWMEIAHAVNNITTEINFYHIKGHCIPFGKVTATNALNADTTGLLLHSMVSKRFNELKPTKEDIFNAAQDLSEKNNGFRLPEEIFKRFVVANVMADAIATKVVEAADREI